MFGGQIKSVRWNYVFFETEKYFQPGDYGCNLSEHGRHIAFIAHRRSLFFPGTTRQRRGRRRFFPFPIPTESKEFHRSKIPKSSIYFTIRPSIRSNLIWDADRKNRRMLVTDDTNNVYLLNSPLSPPVKLMDRIIPYSVKMNPKGGSFAYTSDHENQDNYQLYLYDFTTKTPEKLINLTGKDESIDSFVWSESGDSIYFIKMDYEVKMSKLCRYDFQVEKCYATALKGAWDVMQDGGSKLLLKYFKSSGSQLIYLYDFVNNNLIPV